MMHLRLAAAGLIALLAVSCASQGTAPLPALPGAPPRKPTGEIRKDPSADQALAQVEASARGQPKQKQVEIYLNFRKAYPATTAGEEALYRAGVLSFELGDYVNARKQFNELLFENPLFPQAQDARLKLGLSALELKSYRDAYQTLLPLRDRVSGQQKGAARGRAPQGRRGRTPLRPGDEDGAPEGGVGLDARGAQRRAGPHRRAGGRAGGRPTRWRASRRTSRRRNPAWPLLTFKLARVYQHTRDVPKLKSTLQSLLSSAPGSPYTAEAQEMLARADRVGQVRGRTVGVLLPLTGKYKAFGEAVMRGHPSGAEGQRRRAGGQGHAGRRHARGGRGRGAGLQRRRGGRDRPAVHRGQQARGPGGAGPRVAAADAHPQRGRDRHRPVRLSQHADLLGADPGAGRLGDGRHGLQDLRRALPEHAVRRGDDQRLLGRRRGPRRGDARCGELHLGPDHVHHAVQEAGGPLLPR